MVFFTCDACGESLKKNAVEKHYQFQCRNCSVLSCVDCGKNFPGDTYKEHIRCISEEEKYSGKDFKPKANANKGETKQIQWTEQVHSAISKAKTDHKLKNLLERLIDYPNIPRKKAKFENFLKNSLRVWDAGLCTRTWELIAAEMTPPSGANSQNNNGSSKLVEVEKPKEQTQNGTSSESDPSNGENEVPEKKLSKRERKEERRKLQNKEEKKQKRKQKQEDEEQEVPTKKKKNKKRKNEKSEDEEEDHLTEPVKKKKKKSDISEEEMAVPETEDNVKVSKFTWEGAIIGVLRKQDDNELGVKKLRKKVMAEYYTYGGDAKGKSEEDLLAKFNKKINKNPRLRVLKDKVKLLH